MKKSSQLTLAF